MILPDPGVSRVVMRPLQRDPSAAPFGIPPDGAYCGANRRLLRCRLASHNGIDPRLAGERLHEIKKAMGRGGADNVVFDLTGNIFSPETGAWLGSLTAGGAKRIR